MINSIESERLTRLIERKEKHYQKLKAEKPDDPALLYLNSEITFLRDEILPIVLTNTTVDYSEIRNFVTTSMRRIENNRNLAKIATDLIIHFHIRNPEPGKRYVAAKASNMPQRLNDFNVNINYEEALIYPL